MAGKTRDLSHAAPRTMAGTRQANIIWYVAKTCGAGEV